MVGTYDVVFKIYRTWPGWKTDHLSRNDFSTSIRPASWLCGEDPCFVLEVWVECPECLVCYISVSQMKIEHFITIRHTWNDMFAYIMKSVLCICDIRIEIKSFKRPWNVFEKVLQKERVLFVETWSNLYHRCIVWRSELISVVS